MTEQPQDQAGDEVQLPDERVEDLEPEGEESADVAGGGNYKPGELTLKRGTGDMR
jgi:hypothetical protein